MEDIPVVSHLRADLIGNIANEPFLEGKVKISNELIPYIGFSAVLKNDIGMGEVIDQTIKCLVVGNESVAWWKHLNGQPGDVVIMNNVALYMRNNELFARIFHSGEYQILKEVKGKSLAEKKDFDKTYADDFFMSVWEERRAK